MTNKTKILFITSTRIGDAVLSTGLIAHLLNAYLNPSFTIVCGPLPSSLFEGVPGLEKLIALKKKPYHGHWLELWSHVAGVRWDVVVDLRNSAISRLVLARKRYIFGPSIDQNKHKVEQAAQVMNLSSVPSPALWFTPEQKHKAAFLIPEGRPVLAVGPTANWAGKTWPADHFKEIISWLTESKGLMPDARVAIFAAPGEEAVAYDVLNSIPKDRQINVIAKGNPGEIAAALTRCDFYIGNDSGLMHSAACVGVPTFGLFGPSYPHLYSPWGAHTAFARTPESFDELIAFKGYDSKTVGTLMKTLTVPAVQDALMEFFKNQKKAA